MIINMNKIIVEVKGMKCPMCEKHVNELIKNSFDVKSVVSSHEKNETVIITSMEISDEELLKVLNTTGYTIGKIERLEAKRVGLSWK